MNTRTVFSPAQITESKPSKLAWFGLPALFHFLTRAPEPENQTSRFVTTPQQSFQNLLKQERELTRKNLQERIKNKLKSNGGETWADHIFQEIQRAEQANISNMRQIAVLKADTEHNDSIIRNMTQLFQQIEKSMLDNYERQAQMLSLSEPSQAVSEAPISLGTVGSNPGRSEAFAQQSTLLHRQATPAAQAGMYVPPVNDLRTAR